MVSGGVIYQSNHVSPNGSEEQRLELNRFLTDYFTMTDMFGYELTKAAQDLKDLGRPAGGKPGLTREKAR